MTPQPLAEMGVPLRRRGLAGGGRHTVRRRRRATGALRAGRGTVGNPMLRQDLAERGIAVGTKSLSAAQGRRGPSPGGQRSPY